MSVMKKDRIRWILAVGLLGLLGFSSCSPRLRARRIVEQNADTLQLFPDSLQIKPGPGEMPIRLMYGVPPVRYEVRELRDNEKTE